MSLENPKDEIGWGKVSLIVDSGTSVTVIPEDKLTDHPIIPTNASKSCRFWFVTHIDSRRLSFLVASFLAACLRRGGLDFCLQSMELLP